MSRVLGTLLMIVAGAAAAGAAAQPPAPVPGLPEANARIQSKDFEGAVRILDAVVAREPQNVRAWTLLGSAHHQNKQYDSAIAAYQKLLAIRPNAATVLYNMGCAYALKKDADRAFEWLNKAKATGAMDMTTIQNDTDLAAYRNDPRFAALLPTPADFANPFVEPAKVLRQWDGEAANDQFAWIARNIGDVDKDGVPDVITSAPTKDIGGANAGRVYAYSTKSGALLWKADGRPGDWLGMGVESAGDTNKDGVPDAIATAPGASRAYIYSGANGAVLHTLTAAPPVGFGAASTAGDVNHDGHADVIVGASGSSQTSAVSTGPGRAYVFSGKDGKLLQTLTGEREGDAFGSAVGGSAGAGPALLVVGAPTAGPNKTGRTYVYDGTSDKPKFTIDADETGAALGAMFVSVVGDVDGDGTPDAYTTDFPNRARGPATGRIYVHSGKDGRRLLSLTGETAGEGFGIGAATAGDVDGDGHADLVVGAWQYAGAAQSGGRTYLYSGKDGRLLRTWTGRIPGETFGFDAVGMGDVDQDGTIDLLITSAWSGIKGFHSGRMFIISSGIPMRRPGQGGRSPGPQHR